MSTKKYKGQKVSATLITSDERDKFPIVNMRDVSGGSQSVYSVSDMYAIP